MCFRETFLIFFLPPSAHRLNPTANLINLRLSTNITGCLVLLTFHVADKINSTPQLWMMFSLETRADSRRLRFPGCPLKIFSSRFYEPTKARRLTWHRQRVLSWEWLTHQNPLPTVYLHPHGNRIKCWSFLCARFVESICREKCRMYWVMISIKFGAVLTEGWRPVRGYTLQHRIPSGRRTRRLVGEAKAFIDITLEPLFFSFIYFPSWVADLDDAEDRSLSKSNYTPSYTRFIASVGRTAKGKLRWLATTFDDARDVGGLRGSTRTASEFQLNQTANVIWIPIETTNRFNRSFRLLPASLIFRSAFFFWGKPIFLSVDVCFLGQHRGVEKRKIISAA